MTTTSLSVREAATITGRSKQGILKSIHDGRLSAARGDNQEWLIEPVELARVFDIHTGNGDNQQPEVSSNCQAELDGLREKVTLLERMIRDKDDTLLDLRKRLDVATEEAQRLSAVVTSQLPQPKAAKAGWWQRLLDGA